MTTEAIKLLKPHTEEGSGAELYQGGPRYDNQSGGRADGRDSYYIDLSADDMDAIRMGGGRIWVAWRSTGIGAPIVHTGGRVGDSILISVREAEPWQLASLEKQTKLNGVALDQTRAVVIVKAWDLSEIVFFMYRDEAPDITAGEFVEMSELDRLKRLRI